MTINERISANITVATYKLLEEISKGNKININELAENAINYLDWYLDNHEFIGYIDSKGSGELPLSSYIDISDFLQPRKTINTSKIAYEKLEKIKISTNYSFSRIIEDALHLYAFTKKLGMEAKEVRSYNPIPENFVKIRFLNYI